MKKKTSNRSGSVLARLKNIALRDNFDFNFLLIRYIQERFLARLAGSGYVNKFILKGGFLLIAYNIERARPTKDIDFLGVDISRDRKDLEQLIVEITVVDLDDGVIFIPDSVKSEVIKENADYEGVRIKVMARIGSARNTLQIDFGFGDVVSPHPLQMNYPTLLDSESVKIFAYSRETIVAEKFEAIVKLTSFNTRMKDFYDITFLANEFDFDGGMLYAAIHNTFERRQTSLNSARELLQSDFGFQASFQRQWEAFKKRGRVTLNQDFNEVFGNIRLFLLPIVGAADEGKQMNLSWKSKDARWE